MSFLILRSQRATVSLIALVSALTVSEAIAQQAASLPELRVEGRRQTVQPRVNRPATRRAAPPRMDQATPAQAPSTAQSAGSSAALVSSAGSSATVTGEAVQVGRATSGDVASLLSGIPGAATAPAGGVSGLPYLQGMADDRNRVLMGGVDITSACANHMNPATSYSTPGLVGQVEVLKGNVPVSKGGDSSGGTIVVSPPDPRFAEKDGVRTGGSFGGAFTSNGKGTTVFGTASAATRQFSLDYAGAWSRADNYTSGNGRTVKSTGFSSQNHAVQAAYQNDGHLFTLRGTYQDIPRQGFANQRMDMLGNEGKTLSGTYKGAFHWGQLEANAFWHGTRHYMNFLKDKGGSTPATGMPMRTDGVDFGYAVKAVVDLDANRKLRIGNEFHGQRLDDWWDPVAGMRTSMCCNTFWNIRNGQRDRFSSFAEMENRWNPQWVSTFGIRTDIVHMNTGTVQGYSNVNVGPGMMGPMVTVNYLQDAAAFNAARREKTDVNLDLAAVTKYEPDASQSYEFGVTRKTRSPSLYERYTWSKGSPTFGMSPNMVNWFGDANGYVGNLALKPEAAHRLGVTGTWRDAKSGVWEVSLAPYASYVQNYIDADLLWRQRTMMGMNTPFVTLQFANHDAAIAGFDLSGRYRLLEDARMGRLTLSGFFSYLNGRNLDTNRNLFHMMPPNGKLALEHAIGLWGGELKTTLEMEAVAAKTHVDTVRRELKTPAYALFNLRSSYSYRQFRFDLGVENLFDKQYASPLGGADFTAYRSTGVLGPLAGRGRTLYSAMAVTF